MGGGGGRVGGGDRLGQAELPLAQSGLDAGRFRVPVAAPVAGQDGGDLGAGQFLAPAAGVGALTRSSSASVLVSARFA
jgi:hypothetical protein